MVVVVEHSGSLALATRPCIRSVPWCNFLLRYIIRHRQTELETKPPIRQYLHLDLPRRRSGQHQQPWGQSKWEECARKTHRVLHSPFLSDTHRDLAVRRRWVRCTHRCTCRRVHLALSAVPRSYHTLHNRAASATRTSQATPHKLRRGSHRRTHTRTHARPPQSPPADICRRVHKEVAKPRTRGTYTGPRANQLYTCNGT